VSAPTEADAVTTPHEVVMHTVLAGKPYTWIRDTPAGPLRLVKMDPETREQLGAALMAEAGS
jgi:hypothetical protein